jgi:hypothetical protein
MNGTHDFFLDQSGRNQMYHEVKVLTVQSIYCVIDQIDPFELMVQDFVKEKNVKNLCEVTTLLNELLKRVRGISKQSVKNELNLRW